VKAPLCPRTLRAVGRWHAKRQRDLNWAGMRAQEPTNRQALFAQAEAHGNAEAHWKTEARAVERKQKPKGKRKT
jgi:hypothetical protein